MKPVKAGESSPLRMPSHAVEALERLRCSYTKSVLGTPRLEADQAVQRVVELTLENAKNAQRTA